MKGELFDLIIKGKIDEVICKLQDILSDKNSRLFHQLILIGFGWEELKIDRTSGRLEQEEINYEKSKLIHSLLNLIEDISNEGIVPTKQIQEKQLNHKKIIGLGLSMHIAFGYYNSFLKRINTDLKEDVIELLFDSYGDRKKILTKNVKIEIWVPQAESAFYNLKEIIISEGLTSVSICTLYSRPIPIYGKFENEIATLIDISTSLDSIRSVYKIFQDKFSFKSTFEEELELFIESIEFLINLEGDMKSRISIIKK